MLRGPWHTDPSHGTAVAGGVSPGRGTRASYTSNPPSVSPATSPSAVAKNTSSPFSLLSSRNEFRALFPVEIKYTTPFSHSYTSRPCFTRLFSAISTSGESVFASRDTNGSGESKKILSPSADIPRSFTIPLTSSPSSASYVSLARRTDIDASPEGVTPAGGHDTHPNVLLGTS